MKFVDTKGREHKVDIRPSKWKRKEIGEGRGRFQSEVGECLAEAYPSQIILEEFPLPGENLTLDFFLPRKKLAIEVQGAQHYQYSEFFHKDKGAFRASQERDKRKAQWCRINDVRLILIDWGMKDANILNLLP
jgi:hypothetical protein